MFYKCVQTARRQPASWTGIASFIPPFLGALHLPWQQVVLLQHTWELVRHKHTQKHIHTPGLFRRLCNAQLPTDVAAIGSFASFLISGQTPDLAAAYPLSSLRFPAVALQLTVIRSLFLFTPSPPPPPSLFASGVLPYIEVEGVTSILSPRETSASVYIPEADVGETNGKIRFYLIR